MCYITICDDVFEERRKLRRFLKDGLGASGMEAEIMEYDSGVSLLSDWKRDGIPMDMLFLDIYMKDLTVWKRRAGCGKKTAGQILYF